MKTDRSNTGLPLLSIGLPVYNGLPYLKQRLDSLCNQDLDDLEIVVCDNASTDDTEALVREYSSRDPRITYIRHPANIGASKNYIETFRRARGKYFRWAASDDYETPGALKRCVEALEANPRLVLAFPETKVVDSNGAEIEEYDDGEGWAAPTPTRRFAFSLTQWGYCNVIFGVMRPKVLAQTVLLGDYPASDLVWQADMAIRGPFYRVKGEYYHRRIHERATDGLDAEALAQFYDPSGERSFPTKFLNMFRELVKVVWHSPTSTYQKVTMFAMLARAATWSHRQVAAEIRTVLRNRPRS